MIARNILRRLHLIDEDCTHTLMRESDAERRFDKAAKTAEDSITNANHVTKEITSRPVPGSWEELFQANSPKRMPR